MGEASMSKDPDEIAKNIAQLNAEIAKASAEHVVRQLNTNPWFNGRSDRVQDLIERVIIVAHYRMSGNS